MTEFSNIGVIGKRNDEGVALTVERLVDYLDQAGVSVQIDEASADYLEGRDAQIVSREKLAADCDLLVVVGGDGTLLHAGRTVMGHGVPLLGVNLGRLGFMVDVLPDTMIATLERILAGDYVAEKRLLLESKVIRGDGGEEGPFFSLNDTVLRNKDFARLLEFDTYLDGVFISHHRADGLIVSTPTGSTAYALSGGGPVLHPEIEAVAMVPICPHTLSDRPLVVDAERIIEVLVSEANTTQALMTCDGQSNLTLSGGDKVRIRRAADTLTLIHPPDYDYFNILRNKLHWGRSKQS